MQVGGVATPVVATTMRVLGTDVAETPLVATAKDFRRQGLAKLLFKGLEGFFKQVGVCVRGPAWPRISMHEDFISGLNTRRIVPHVRCVLCGVNLVLIQVVIGVWTWAQTAFRPRLLVKLIAIWRRLLHAHCVSSLSPRAEIVCEKPVTCF